MASAAAVLVGSLWLGQFGIISADDTNATGEADREVPFIKGQLAYPGTREMLSRFDHITVQTGAAFIGNELYAVVDPGAAFYHQKWGFAGHVPLNLLVVDIGKAVRDEFEFENLKIRREDWDEAADFARIIRFITYGRKEEPVYFTINTLRPASIGHGMLLNKYQGNIDVDRSLTGVLFDAYNAYGGFELQLNDLTLNNRLLGGLVFVKPLALLTDNPMARTLSLGVEYVGDHKAPLCVRRGDGTGACVQGAGNQTGRNPVDDTTLDATFVRTDPDTGRYRTKNTTVHATGFSAELKVYKDVNRERNVDLKLYSTYHRFLNDGGGDGVAGGFLARLNYGNRWVSAWRLRGEYRTFTDGFLPNYFDTMYEINKYEFQRAAQNYQVTPTKAQAIFGDPDNGFARPNLGRRHGFNLETTWALFRFKRSQKRIAVSAGVQDANGPFDSTLYVHTEVPALSFLQLFGTFLRTNEGRFVDLFDIGSITESPNVTVLSGFRLEFLPFVFLNLHFSRTRRIVRSPGSEYRLGNSNIVDVAGQPSPLTNDQLFENVNTLFVKLEFGAEFVDGPSSERGNDET